MTIKFPELPTPELIEECPSIYLIIGDSRQILPLLPDQSFDLGILDPPYNAGKNYGLYKDNLGPEVYRLWVADILFHMYRLCKITAVLAPIRHLPLWTHIIPPDLIIVVNEGSKGIKSVPNTSIRQKITYEPVLIYCSAKNHMADFTTHYYTVPEKPFEDHPNAKPVNIIMRLIAESQASSLIDPFCGTGTSLVAAKRCHIPALGIELNPQYRGIMLHRLRQEVLPFQLPVEPEQLTFEHSSNSTSKGD